MRLFLGGLRGDGIHLPGVMGSGVPGSGVIAVGSTSGMVLVVAMKYPVTLDYQPLD